MIEVADRLKGVKEYYFSTKLEEIREMRLNGIDVLNLGIGSPDLAPAESTIWELVTSARNAKNHAYQPYRSIIELREAMSAFYNRTYNVELDAANEVLPLLGSKEGIMYLSMAFLNPEDEVLVPNPGYPAYAAIANLIGAKVRTYDLVEANGWLPNYKALANEDLSKVKLMWVTYPNMPTGAPASEEVFKDLVKFGADNNILVCNDNPYSLVLNPNPLSILNFDNTKEHVIELNSLSKAFNMAGWRVGMVLGHEDYINAILRVKSNVDSGMFLPVQHAAVHALNHPDTWHNERNEVYQERKGIVTEILETIGCSVSEKQVGLFVWGKLQDGSIEVRDIVDDLLHKAHVFVTPGEIFGSNGDRYLRMSLCAKKEVFEEALNRVKLWKSTK